MKSKLSWLRADESKAEVDVNNVNAFQCLSDAVASMKPRHQRLAASWWTKFFERFPGTKYDIRDKLPDHPDDEDIDDSLQDCLEQWVAADPTQRDPEPLAAALSADKTINPTEFYAVIVACQELGSQQRVWHAHSVLIRSALASAVGRTPISIRQCFWFCEYRPGFTLSSTI